MIALILFLCNYVFFLTFVFVLQQISSLAKSLRMLADMEEPVGQILKRIEVKSKLKTLFHSFEGGSLILQSLMNHLFFLFSEAK